MINKFKCQQCGETYSIKDLEYKCSCGGLFSLDLNIKGLFETELTLGEGKTPVIKQNLEGKEVFLKLDYLMPTGSFKDRGAVVMIDKMLKHGIREIVEDSSGNAGAAVAAYAAAAGIKCSIYTPESTSPEKLKQIQAYGARLIRVPGDREQTSQKVKEAAVEVHYASHIYNPLFFAGVSSLAQELMENPGEPDIIFVPAGNGTLLLGLYHGFKNRGYLPKLIAVQSQNCAPLYDKIKGVQSEKTNTVAEGIAIKNPPRKQEMIKAIQESKGEIIRVSEKRIKKAQKILNYKGFYIEPTAAVAPAGFLKYKEKNKSLRGNIIIPLTGTGLKK